ncbi:hypothetical protein CDL15_Pgr019115 [Punica granatum]|nr:hypothetical protein CDL15_Pgr019115 [Punica granatum]PKI31138.1 hypothetical protein CRG98_048480 [Punica granatum]
MRKNCNLKLQLQPSSGTDLLPRPYLDTAAGSPHRDDHHHQQQQQQQEQQLTIFYNGQVCVCNVTEVQARALMMLASREMMGTSPSGGSSPRDQEEEDSSISPLSYYSRMASAHTPSMPSPTTAFSMKRSLQRFLQKRRHRISAAAPYNVR